METKWKKYEDKTFRNASEFTQYEVRHGNTPMISPLLFSFPKSYDSYLPYSGFYA